MGTGCRKRGRERGKTKKATRGGSKKYPADATIDLVAHLVKVRATHCKRKDEGILTDHESRCRRESGRY